MSDEIHEFNERFFALSIDMLCIAHFNGFFRRINQAWERTLGFTREELKAALAEVRELQEILPICCPSCYQTEIEPHMKDIADSR